MNGPAVMKPRPQWSIIVPLYNKQDFIEATLQSVLGQVGAVDFEIVVVDDGSRDQGPERVVALGDPRIRLIRQVNAGVSAARNRGILEAQGCWVVFLDADDLLHPAALSAYEALRSQYPQAKVLGGAYVRVANADVAVHKFQPHELGTDSRLIEDLPSQILCAGMAFSASSIAIDREFLAQLEVWFPEGESIGEDLDLWLRIVERTAVAFTSNCIALYRVELAASLTSMRTFDHLFPYLQRLESRARTRKMPARLVGPSLKLVADARVSMARESIRRGRRRAAPGLLLVAWRRIASVRWWFTWAAVLAPGLLRWRER